MDNRESFLFGILAGLVIATGIGLLLVACLPDPADAIASGEVALSEAEIDYMLSESIGRKVVLFATEQGRVLYYDGALFKEME